MIQTLLWLLAVLFVALIVYLLSYYQFRRMILQQTKQMIALMKSEDVDNMQIGSIYAHTSDDFSELERAALYLRRKYLRLRNQFHEERKGYETVFSGLKEGIVTVDQNLKIISFNESFMAFFNWIPDKAQPNTYLQDVVREPQVIATFKKTFEDSNIHKTEVDPVQLFVTPLPSRNENERWSLGVFYDMSEIKKTEKIRIDFVANASHEMRTPLTVIKGYSELMKQKIEQDDLNGPEILDLLNPVLQSADQMSDLMNRLLNLSRVEVNAPLAKSLVSTEQITSEVLQDIEGLVSLKHKNIVVKCEANEVFVNPESCKQILSNLLTNAVKYSGEAHDIIVTWVKAPQSVLLKVKDNGPGIVKEHQSRVFERFYRVDKGRSRDQGGYGLGLAFVKHHMLNHGGSVRLVSENNMGSEFICEFPNP